MTPLISTSSRQQRHNIKLSDTLNITLNHPIRDICTLCDANGVRVNKKLVVRIDNIPPLIMFECWSVRPTPEAEISISTNTEIVSLRLCGLIYAGDGHFNSRVFDQNGSVWKHDGMENGGQFRYEKLIDLLTDMKQFENNNNKTIMYHIYKKI